MAAQHADSRGYDIASLAVNHGDKASFFDFTAFKKTAEIIQMYVKKGAKLCIHSRAHQESWMDKTTGVNRHAVRFVITSMEFIGSKQDTQPAQAAAVQPQPSMAQGQPGAVPFDPPGTVDDFEFPQPDGDGDPFAE